MAHNVRCINCCQPATIIREMNSNDVMRLCVALIAVLGIISIMIILEK